MRRFGVMVLAAVLPVAGFAQDAVIRIEAKRGEQAAAEAASAWGQRFENVVTFPLARGWVAVALGPLTPEQAAARLAELKAAGRIPADSFVAVPPASVTLSPAGSASAGDGATEMPQDALVEDVPAEEVPEVVPVEEVPAQPDMAAPGSYIRLQSVQSADEADAALALWRETFPEAGLWALPGGWWSVALGPLTPAAAQAWLAAFKAGGDLPGDAFASDASEMGQVVDAGRTPDLPAPEESAEMPPLDQVQRALRWAGHYDGAMDGQAGPRTREAIARAVADLRISPDAGTAMRALIDRRQNWRGEMGLTTLRDEATGLSVNAPMEKLAFDRAERALSIYGPKDESGAALILFSQPGGQQELLDLSGLVTALGWVPQPDRTIEPGHILLEGANEHHRSRAEGWVRDGRAEGFVLIWPAGDAQNQSRLAAELSDSFRRFGPAANDTAAATSANPVQR
ncbi:peptidoglycan-binding domain-containing protein [Paracoccus salsus]|uniref:peptidoglycan-binding domain-containing protein n=1 Tax=Paracoccus salsus TaxID=2911061 RepID=UPI001F1ADABD|nr:peptidoglycan-binding domain-containing protein [Paracoccus salsus]MCF3974110.1 peptidoglycan-binding protein [Paracoccus salsus]